MTSTVPPAWDDDEPTRVNAEMVPPTQRRHEGLAMGTQARSERLQGVYLVILVAAPAATFALRTADAPEQVADAAGALLLLVGLAVQLWRRHRAPDGAWVRHRMAFETAKSQAWRRAVTGSATAGDSVRCKGLGAATLDERWAYYRRFRIEDQITWFEERGGQHRREARWTKVAQVLFSVAALTFATIQAFQLRQVPIVGLVVSLLTATEAWAQFRRAAFISSDYSAAATALRAVPEQVPPGDAELAGVVDGVEHQLERELWTWVAINSTAVLTEPRPE